MNRYIVTFDKSNEDIPTLIVGTESYFALSPSMSIVNIITGDKAIKIFNEIGGKAESEEGISDEN